MTLAGNLARLKETVVLRFYTALKIPLIAYLRPSVKELTDERCLVRIPLMRRTKNHLNAMYFGALCAGADLAGGLVAMRRIQQRGDKVVFVFKDFQADFLKRAQGDVLFCCDDGRRLTALVARAEESGERVEETVSVVATCPSDLGDEPVARFRLTISLKRRR